MKLLVLCICSCIVGTQSLVDTHSRLKRSSSQLDSLKQKLSNLQDLLKKIDKEEEQPSAAPQTTVNPQNIDMAKETMMTQSRNTDNTDKNKLSSDEVAMLMAVRNTLNRQRQNKDKLRQELENKETYYDRPAVEEGTDDITILKALANKLSRNKDEGQGLANKLSRNKNEGQGLANKLSRNENAGQGLANKLSRNENAGQGLANKLSRNENAGQGLANKLSRNENAGQGLANKLSRKQEAEKDNLSDNRQPQPKEGKFTLFRQEVLAQVEDRLLQDIDFALKMGFSVDEILKDLQEKEKRYKELQRAEMQQRIEALRKIRD